MRKIVFIIVCMLSVMLHAQHIKSDRIERNGSHQITTTSKTVRIDYEKYLFCMKIRERGDQVEWFLLIGSFTQLPPTAFAMLQLYDEEVVLLVHKKTNKGKYWCQDHIRIDDHQTIVKYNDHDCYTSIYEITPYQMDLIKEHGIKNVTFAFGDYRKTKTFTKNQLGKFLNGCRKKLQWRLDHPLDEFDIVDKRQKEY